jgi:hypothetical protein
MLRCIGLLLFTALIASTPALTEDVQKDAEKDAKKESSSEKSFLRTVEGDNGVDRLETSIATYSRPDGVRVHLVAAVHIGDGGYYRKLNRIFEEYDALLYELVAEADTIPLADTESSNPVSLFQRALTDVLDLQFQLDLIDYTRPNFVHADMSPDDFGRRQEERGESFLTYFFRAYRTELERQQKGDFSSTPSPFDALKVLLSNDKTTEIKRVLAKQFADADRVSEIIQGKDGSAILTDRNKVAVDVLKRTLDEGKKNVGIFYGAAHMPDFEERLTGELGFKKDREIWLTAWDISRPAKQPSIFRRLFLPGKTSAVKTSRRQRF